MSKPTYEFVAQSSIPFGKDSWFVRAYRSEHKHMEPLVIFSEIKKDEIPLVRVHDACFTSEVLGSLKCDCKSQLDKALSMIILLVLQSSSVIPIYSSSQYQSSGG